MDSFLGFYLLSLSVDLRVAWDLELCKGHRNQKLWEKPSISSQRTRNGDFKQSVGNPHWFSLPLFLSWPCPRPALITGLHATMATAVRSPKTLRENVPLPLEELGNRESMVWRLCRDNLHLFILSFLLLFCSTSDPNHTEPHGSFSETIYMARGTARGSIWKRMNVMKILEKEKDIGERESPISVYDPA